MWKLRRSEISTSLVDLRLLPRTRCQLHARGKGGYFLQIEVWTSFRSETIGSTDIQTDAKTPFNASTAAAYWLLTSPTVAVMWVAPMRVNFYVA